MSSIKLFHTYTLNYIPNASPTISTAYEPPLTSLISWLIPTVTTESQPPPPPSVDLPSRTQQNPIYYSSTNAPTTRPPPSSTAAPVVPYQSGRFDEANSQCGIPSYHVQQSTGLVVQGRVSAKGQVRKINGTN